MSMKYKKETEIRGVNIVDPKSIDTSQALSIVVMKLNLQIEKRIEWIDCKRQTIIGNFRFSKVFRKLIALQIDQYELDIEYIKTQLLILGKPYGSHQK